VKCVTGHAPVIANLATMRLIAEQTIPLGPERAAFMVSSVAVGGSSSVE
jgi:hypothetical protein